MLELEAARSDALPVRHHTGLDAAASPLGDTELLPQRVKHFDLRGERHSPAKERPEPARLSPALAYGAGTRNEVIS